MAVRAFVIVIPAVVFAAAACRKETTLPAASPPASGEREALLRQIAALPEVAPCLAGAGTGTGTGTEAAIRLTDAELAGEAATVSFACTHAPISGRVTFFRIA